MSKKYLTLREISQYYQMSVEDFVKHYGEELFFQNGCFFYPPEINAYLERKFN